MNNIEEFAQSLAESTEFHSTVKQNENLSSHTTMHVGGAAKLFLEPSDSESLVFAVRKLIEENVGFFILGGGSNVIISDEGLDAVISTRKMNTVKFLTERTEFTEKIQNEEKQSSKIRSLCTPKLCEKFMKVGCGASWGSVISFCKKNNLCGFEGFTGLSGTVGGALFMNATCFGLSACDNLVSVEYFDTRDLQVHTYEKNEADWGYKKSPFQSTDFHRFPQIDGGRCGELPAEWGGGATKCDAGERLLPSKIILSAIFCVHDGFDSQKSENCLASRKEKGHFRAPSSGSAFKNDAVHGIIAGKVIDECALKGFSVGGAQIAPWHGNFIINPEQKATARDIKTLSDEVKKIVREKTGIALENEILFVGL
ncbi:MAG: FAD-binding protein [Treponema sp.]|nr:FAD-binding protein [Treponema sp.]